MTDDELRRLVRDAIARHLGPAGGATAQDAVPRRNDRVEPPWRAHPSFGKFLVMAGDEDGGPCLIEPAVRCNHCGFCQSYGH
jgi:hypothetical protein